MGAIAAAALGAVGVMLLRPARSSGRTPGAPVDAAPLVISPAPDAAVTALAVSPDAAPVSSDATLVLADDESPEFAALKAQFLNAPKAAPAVAPPAPRVDALPPPAPAPCPPRVS